MVSEIQNQQLIDENQKLKTDYAILKNNFEFIEKENKELKEQIKKVKEWVKYNKYEDGCIDCDFIETDKLLDILRESNRITEDIKNSGIYYYECPLCKDVLNHYFEREHYTEPMEGFFYCPKCDKKFYARHHFENIVTASELPLPLFEAHSISNGELYTLKKMQYGKEVTE